MRARMGSAATFLPISPILSSLFLFMGDPEIKSGMRDSFSPRFGHQGRLLGRVKDVSVQEV